MDLGSRWVKILNDIWGNKTRSILVILSIAVGVGVVGMINNGRMMIERDLYSQFAAGNPASVQIYTSPFQKDLTNAIEDHPNVEAVEGRRMAGVQILFPDEKVDLTFVVSEDQEKNKVNIPAPIEGKSTPGLREIAVELQAADALEINIGDELQIEKSDGKIISLTVVGIINDIYEIPYAIRGEVFGIVDMRTLQWMGYQAYFNRLDVVIQDHNNDRDYVLDIAADIRDRIIQPSGVVVGSIQIPGLQADPGEHWAQNQISGFILILQLMSVMAIFLSAGLVVNTITAILTNQVKQIGIMRSIGAVPRQVGGMYIFNIFIFSLAGLLLSIPISWFGSLYLTRFAAGFLNFKITSAGIFPSMLILQTVLAMIIPIGVALWPILAGIRISVFNAIYQNGLVQEGQKPWLEKLLLRLSFLKPPVVLSVINTFRNIPRLAFTLITLTLAGATFVATFSTRSSLNAQVVELGRYLNYDAAISVSSHVSKFTAVPEASRIPGVVAAEGWASVIGLIQTSRGEEGAEVEITGLPFDTIMMDPKLEEGRWLNDGDNWQVVVNRDLIQETNLSLGDELVVKLLNVDRKFKIVGITTKTIRAPIVYINYAMFSKITGNNDQVNQVRVRTDLEKIADVETQTATALLLEDRFHKAGLSNGLGQSQFQIFGFFSEPFDIILVVLVIMASLLAVVGSLSLAGTMGINVMERTREIGVLRSVGASNLSIRQVVVVEGVVIAVISWLFVVVISGPASAAMAGAVIFAVFKTALTFQFSYIGLFLWLLIVVVIGIISSLAPAGKAVRLTVREVLDYE